MFVISDTSCGGKPADIIFLIDSSTSIWGPHFRKQIKFVRNVVEEFDVRNTRIGVLTFGDFTRVQFDLERYSNRKNLIMAINAIFQSGGGTRTDGALMRAAEIFAAQSRPGVPHIAILMSDGDSDFPDRTKEQASLLQLMGIHVFAVGIGDNIKETELHNIASQESYIFKASTFDTLTYLKKMLAVKACAGRYIT